MTNPAENIFSFVKQRITLSDFVRTLPNLSAISSTGRGKWRCNNVISGGDNPTAMVLDDDSGFFKVFSHDQQHGDVITLYQMTIGNESASPFDSAVALAGHMGVSIDESLLQRNANTLTHRDMVEALETLTDRAHDYLLFSSNDDAYCAREYLEDRGMDSDLIVSWRLGLFPEKNRDFHDLIDGIDDTVLHATGMVSKKNSRFFPMQGRLIFPIMSASGKTISFSSRVVEGISTPLPDSKYINTSTTDIYDKSTTLYGQHLISKDTQSIIICEGNFDVIALNALAPHNTIAVATCGTALTVGHVSMLSKKKNITHVSVLFDADEAGGDATSKSLWLHNHWNLVSTLSIPQGKDPWDSFTQGVDFNEIDSTAQPLMSFAVKHKFSRLSKNDFISWCAQSYASLNFTDDKELFLHDVQEVSGITRKTLLSTDSHDKRIDRHHHARQGSSSTLSQSVKEIIPALLVMDADTRRTLCFPLVVKSLQQAALSLCGCVTQEDEDILIAVVTGNRHSVSHSGISEAYSLYPGGDTEETFIHTARYLARSLLFTWRYDDNVSPVVGLVAALQTIASGKSGADGMSQISFVFEALATSIHQ